MTACDYIWESTIWLRSKGVLIGGSLVSVMVAVTSMSGLVVSGLNDGWVEVGLWTCVATKDMGIIELKDRGCVRVLLD